MALKDILERIARESKTEAGLIRQEAEAHAAKVRQEAESRAEQSKADLRKRSEERAESERLRLINSALLENRKRVLTERQRAIEAAFATVKERIKGLSDRDFERCTLSLLKRAKPDGDEELIVPNADQARYTPQLIGAMNKALGDRGKLRLSEETGDFEGGFILRKGPRKDDLRLARVLSELREEIEPEIVGILFGDKGGT